MTPQRFAFLLLSTAAFTLASQWPSRAAMPAPQELPAAGGADTNVQLAAVSRALHDGTFTGGTYSAYYGPIQVQAVVSGGKLVNVKAVRFPNKSGTSRSINRQALPYLQSEVVAAQSERVNIISGATLTSRAYVRSLHDALGQSRQ